MIFGLAAGCTGLVGGGSGDDTDLTPAQRVANTAWLAQALPHLAAECLGCHGNIPMDDAPAFLAAPNDLAIRDVLVAFAPEVVNLDAPQASRLMTKGLHDGPAWSASEAADVLAWIAAERDARDVTTPPITTQPYTVMICADPGSGDTSCQLNSVDLMPAGVDGASITFFAQELAGPIMYLTDLELVAPSGAFVQHPVFASQPANAAPIVSGDPLYDVTLDVEAGSAPIVGALALVGFAATDPIVITFHAVGPYDPSMAPTMPPSACKALASFATNAQPALQTYCASCHAGGGNPTAMANMDLTGIDQDVNANPTAVMTACAQTMSNVQPHLSDPANSGLLVTPNPAKATTHPFDFGGVQNAYQTEFADPVSTWIMDEAIAP